MGWKLFVAVRYLTRRSKERFISMISVISVMGVIVGVAALIVVLSIMTGFDIEIKEKIIGTYSHIILLREGGIDNESRLEEILKEEKHVLNTAPFIDEPAYIKTPNGIVGILVRGLDADKERHVTNVNQYVKGGKLDFSGDGIIMGSELMKSLRLAKGDRITLFSPYTGKKFPFENKKKDFRIAGSFTSGRYDYDANLIFMSLAEAKSLFGRNSVSGIGMKVDNEYNVLGIKRSLQRKFQYPFAVKSWMDLDKNLMRALAVEKKMMFIVLGLIILVACFNIAATLIMQVIEKTKDIGILRAIGATSRDIKMIFIFLGLFVGVIGVILGGVAGVLIATNINSIAGFIEQFTGFELFPSEIYYLSEIPAKVQNSDVTLIVAFSLGLAVLASLYPAWKASRLNPVEAIRYE